MKQSVYSKWTGVGHRRKMELKREERAKRIATRAPFSRSTVKSMFKQLTKQKLWSTSKPEPSSISSTPQEQV